MIKLGALISGSGSNLQSVIDNVKSGYLDAEIAVVISDNKNAFGLERAKNHGIPTEVVNFKDFKERALCDKRIVEILNSYKVDLVMLAGYMKIVAPVFINSFKNKIMNIHPALLPSFPGTHAQKQALLHGVKFAGCTVHFVDEGIDTGPIIVQAVVPVLADDTEDSLILRILKEEHKIYPLAIRLFAEGRLKVQGKRVIISPPINAEERFMINPPIDDFFQI